MNVHKLKQHCKAERLMQSYRKRLLLVSEAKSASLTSDN